MAPQISLPRAVIPLPLPHVATGFLFSGSINTPEDPLRLSPLGIPFVQLETAKEAPQEEEPARETVPR
jgi:hypothetical protein